MFVKSLNLLEKLKKKRKIQNWYINDKNIIWSWNLLEICDTELLIIIIYKFQKL